MLYESSLLRYISHNKVHIQFDTQSKQGSQEQALQSLLDSADYANSYPRITSRGSGIYKFKNNY